MDKKIAVEDIITQAEGYLELGMHEQAWGKLEDLPPIDRVMPEVVNLRLRICTLHQ